METKIDLFKLHDSKEDNNLKKCIMAKGSTLKKKLSELIKPFNETELVKDLMGRFNISIASAERLVYLKKDWFPIFFIEYLLKINNRIYLKYEIQDTIEYLKANQPPVMIYKAVRFLSLDLCKIMGAHAADGTLAKGNLVRITDGYEKSIDIIKEWFDSVFGINVKKVRIKNSSEEWAIELRSKIIGRYLNKVFNFPYGCKQYITREPSLIKKSALENRKAFALGALTFEAGIGITHQISLCVVSKDFRDDLSNILNLSQIKHKVMEKPSSGYWRLWSNMLTKEQAKQWMFFFAEGTEKWWLLKNYVDGFQRKVGSFSEAIIVLNKFYPTKSASKVCLKKVIEIIRQEGKVSRYQLAALLCQENKLADYGGKWAHSLKHYLDILKMANIISVEKRKFGKKKSWGSIVREVYIFNNNISDWRLPSTN